MSEHNAQTVIFVANRPFALVNSRSAIIRKFVEKGWRVIVATVKDKCADDIVNLGATIEEVNFHRSSMSIAKDCRAFFSLCKIYLRYSPKLIHHFHAKPIILGNIAARLVPKAKVVNTVTGIGLSFSASKFITYLSSKGYSFSLQRSAVTIFQNPDDETFFLNKGLIKKDNSMLIVSAGVDLNRFRPVDNNMEKRLLKVLLVTRLLWQKGVREFVEAAEYVKKKRQGVIFQLAGEKDHKHIDAVPEEWIRSKVNDGTIEYLGFIDQIEKKLSDIDIFVFPSYYREGVPRVVLEAAASAVPAIVADVPGSRVTVENAKTGFLVPPKNSQVLVEKILYLLDNKKIREKMGQSARHRVEKHFDIKIITSQYLETYQDIGVFL